MRNPWQSRDQSNAVKLGPEPLTAAGDAVAMVEEGLGSAAASACAAFGSTVGLAAVGDKPPLSVGACGSCHQFLK